MLRRVFKQWLYLAVATTFLILLIFIGVQQVYRQSANDPQIEVAHTVAHHYAAGESLKNIIPPTPVDLTSDLSTFVIVYDHQGNPLAGNGYLNGSLPRLPQGVLDAAAKTGQNLVTWQPQKGLRFALVVAPIPVTNGGYVMSGHTLRLVETRIDSIGKTLFYAWIVWLVCSYVFIFAIELFLPSKRIRR